MALQTQELKPLKIGEEEKLALALKSKSIKDSSFDEVKEVLRFVMMKVGLRAQNLPNDLEKVVLYEHIVSNYSGHTLEEIKVAFDMAISGKLDFTDGQSAVCYENFSCLYFSTIMNAYEKWAAQAHRAAIEPKLPIPEQRIMSQEELDNSAREAVQTQYRSFIKGGEIINPEINKEILAKDGLLKEGEKVVDFYKRMVEKQKLDIYVQAGT